MKIGVLAGTPVDTQMGVDFVLSQGFDAIGRACSESPVIQSEMQILHKKELLDIAIRLCREMESHGAEGIFVNCNSLSGAVDMDEVRRHITISLVTPLDVYKLCAKDYSRLGVIAANGQSLAAIEHLILENNNQCMVVGAGLLPVVIAIENGLEPQKIYDSYKIRELVRSLEAMGCEALVLGCTHFPYLLAQIENNSAIPVINPGMRMLHILKSTC
ncbi:MAG: aspartate/glutamate racemase family protein [Oscillospiraceae bacterium]